MLAMSTTNSTILYSNILPATVDGSSMVLFIKLAAATTTTTNIKKINEDRDYMSINSPLILVLRLGTDLDDSNPCTQFLELDSPE
jgi:hypothetical protein